MLRNYEALSKFKSVKYTVHRTAFKHEGPGRVTGFVECSLQDAENKLNVKGVFIYETQDKMLRKVSRFSVLLWLPTQSDMFSIDCQRYLASLSQSCEIRVEERVSLST